MMQDSIVLGVRKNGNRVDVVGGPRDLFYEIEGPADFTIEQDIAVHPYGNNHVTDRFLRSSDFALTPLNNISRAEKAGNVAANPIALNALTFCNNYRAQSRREAALNCGKYLCGYEFSISNG